MKYRLTAFLLALALLSGTAGALGEAASKYVLVVPDESNLYMQTVYRGFSEACAELGMECMLMHAGEAGDTLSECMEHALLAGAAGVAVSADGIENLTRPILMAQKLGTPLVLSGVVNFQMPPGSVRVGTRMGAAIGVALLQSAYEILDGYGKIAVISKAEDAVEPDPFLAAMLSEMESYPDIYAGIEIVEIVRCYDKPELANRLTKELLNRHPELSLIISTTTVGLVNAARAIVEENSGVKVSGLGIPSEMSEYILSGVCPQMFLWSPLDIGYLVAYTLYNMQLSHESNAPLSAFVAGRLGERFVSVEEEDCLIVPVGNFMIFDRKNILFWSDAF